MTPFAVTTPRAAIAQRAGPGVQVTYDDGSDPAAAAAAAKAADVAVVFAGDYQTEGTDKRCLDARVPARPRRPGRADRARRGGQPEHDRRARDRRPGPDAVARSRPRPPRGVVPGPGGRHGDRARALRRRRPGRAAARPRSRASEADEPTAGDPRSTRAWPRPSTYKEGVLVGYRWFDAHGLTPAYPFGFGLSYTTLRLRPAAHRAVGRRPGGDRRRDEHGHAQRRRCPAALRRPAVARPRGRPAPAPAARLQQAQPAAGRAPPRELHARPARALRIGTPRRARGGWRRAATRSRWAARRATCRCAGAAAGGESPLALFAIRGA